MVKEAPHRSAHLFMDFMLCVPCVPWLLCAATNGSRMRIYEKHDMMSLKLNSEPFPPVRFPIHLESYKKKYV